MPQITSYNDLMEAFVDVRSDLLKAQNGNKAAARRARKKLMKIRDLAHQARKDLLQVSKHVPEKSNTEGNGLSKAPIPAPKKASGQPVSNKPVEPPARTVDMDFDPF